MAVHAQGIIGLHVLDPDCTVVVRTPLEQLHVSDWLALGAVPLVLGVHTLAEVLGVAEVQRHVVGVEAALDGIDLFLEGAGDTLQVGVDADEVFTPVQLLLVDLGRSVGVEVCVDPQLQFISGNRPRFRLACIRLRAGR